MATRSFVRLFDKCIEEEWRIDVVDLLNLLGISPDNIRTIRYEADSYETKVKSTKKDDDGRYESRDILVVQIVRSGKKKRRS